MAAALATAATLATLGAFPCGAAPAGAAVVVKMATLAPEGSTWDQILKAMGEKWRQAPGGGITLRIYPGGVLGDEPDVVRKMRVGQIQAAALTSVGLSDIDDSVAAFQIPMMYRSDEELDYVRDRLRQKLERRLEAKGFVVLNWGDAGWVRFFAKKPFRRPDDLKMMKLFAWAGDNQAVDLWKAAGFNPIPLAATDVLPGLQTGLIDAFDTVPLSAVASQWFGLAPNMLDIEWAPLVGATVITRKAWESIPPAARDVALAAAAEAGERLRDEIRSDNGKAIEAMRKRGLTVITPTPEDEAAWRQAAERVYPKIRGTLVPAPIFDEVRRLLEERRGPGGAAPACPSGE
jgi:TRAP-type C4-dicarboxylate transport system substrate-binding protein